MKITLSYSGGTPCGLQLASQFDNMACLNRLYITFYSRRYPYLTRAFGRFEDKLVVDINKVSTNLHACLYKKLLYKTRNFRKAPKNRDRFRVGNMFDKWVARKISAEKSDLILIESHQALHTIKKAKEIGMVTFLDRTNSHIKIQEKIDSEEANKLQLKSWHDSKDIERGIREYEEVDYILVPSTFVRDGFIKEGFDPDKVLTVSLGTDTNYFKKVNKDDNIFRIIFCGGISHRKGIVYLLEAVSSLKLRNIELWLIGPVENALKDILKKYDGYYKLINFVANYELYKYYSQGSVFVLPTLEDSFGLVIIEAMACGLPAIVTTNCAAGDVVREDVDGFVVPIRDVEALKEKILYLYNNQEFCREMGENARKRVYEKFTLEAYAKRMIAAFEYGLTNNEQLKRKITE